MSETFAAKDVSALLGFVSDLNAVQDLQSFRLQLISKLPKIISSEITSYNEINFASRRHTSLSYPLGATTFPDSEHIFDKHITEHPLIIHYNQTGDCRTLKISDFLGRTQFHNLGLYTDFYRRLGVEHQIAFILPARQASVIGVALNRGSPDFTEHERSLLNLLRPHIIHAYRNAEAFTNIVRRTAEIPRALDQLELPLVVLAPNWRVLVMTSKARQLLNAYFTSSPAGGGRLPEILERWAKDQHSNEHKVDELKPRAPFVVEHQTSRLVFRLVRQDKCRWLLMNEQRNSIPQGSLLLLGLTPREAEVLAWVSQGKTNRAIATVLGLSTRTVQKHLERIFQKLGVETRTAAVARALNPV